MGSKEHTMDEISSQTMLKQVVVSGVIALITATIISIGGQPIWTEVENLLGSGMYLLLLCLSFVWVGFGLAYMSDYAVPPMVVGGSMALLSWPTLIEMLTDTMSDVLFILSGMMWFGFTIGVMIPKAKARVTSGER